MSNTDFLIDNKFYADCFGYIPNVVFKRFRADTKPLEELTSESAGACQQTL